MMKKRRGKNSESERFTKENSERVNSEMESSTKKINEVFSLNEEDTMKLIKRKKAKVDGRQNKIEKKKTRMDKKVLDCACKEKEKLSKKENILTE